MICTVVGVRKVDFTDQATQKRIKGTKVFIEYEQPDDENLSGKVADSVFITEQSGIVVPMFKFGDQYDFVYETVGIGSKAKAKLSKITTKDGKEIKSSPFDPFT